MGIYEIGFREILHFARNDAGDLSRNRSSRFEFV
jgi:hypothetical protein